MSLTSSLNFAVAGLDTSSRRAEVVARNVASADQPGYASRRADISGPGVGLPGSNVAISRNGDPRLTQLRRESESEAAGLSVLSSFHAGLDQAFGDPDDASSLVGRLIRLDQAFLASATEPTSQARLGEISEAADAIANSLNDLDQTVLDARQAADTEIGKSVKQLNADLKAVQQINVDILRRNSGGHETADLLDRRSVLIDRISAQIPLRELPRDNGAVALVSEGGLILLDGKAAELGFLPRTPLTADMVYPIQLSGLSINGKVVATGEETSAVPGGMLEAMFKVRDEDSVSAFARLDGFAAELISRFSDPAVDPTLGSGVPGIFTDGGNVLAGTISPGLAGRIEINDLVAPSETDQHWRLRTGLNAAVPGPASENSLLLSYGSAFSSRQVSGSAALPPIATDIVGHAAALKSLISTDRIRYEDGFQAANGTATDLALQRDGAAVDVDGEMRRLVEIEQAYAANARVIQAVSDMMNRLTEI